MHDKYRSRSYGYQDNFCLHFYPDFKLEKMINKKNNEEYSPEFIKLNDALEKRITELLKANTSKKQYAVCVLAMAGKTQHEIALAMGIKSQAAINRSINVIISKKLKMAIIQDVKIQEIMKAIEAL